MEADTVNDLAAPVRLLMCVAALALAIGGVKSLGFLTRKMAEAAVEAQHDQMSYGNFSRQLWTPDQRLGKESPGSLRIAF